MAFLKIIGGTIASNWRFKCFTPLVGGVACIVNKDFRYKVDRNLIRPYRNYMKNLADVDKFQTQEDFYEFLGSLGTGVGNMFRSEENEQWNWCIIMAIY